MKKMKRKNGSEFRYIQALTACRFVYPVRFHMLMMEGKRDIALAIGYTLIEGLKSKEVRK